MSDQVSSSVIRTRALAAAASAARSPSPFDRGQQIDPGKALERLRHRQQFRLSKGIGRSAPKRKPANSGRLRRMRDHDDGVGHHSVIARVGAVPFQHREFGQMQIAALAVAEHARELEYLGFSGGEQFFGGELRRRPQIARRARAVAAGQFGARRMQMGLVARRDLQDAGLDLGKALLVEPGPHRPRDRAPRHQERLSVGMPRGRPPGRRLVGPVHQQRSLRSHGALSAEPKQAFKESTRTIEIVRLSLMTRMRSRRQGSASIRLVMAKADSPCPCRPMQADAELRAVRRADLKSGFSAPLIGRRNRQVTGGEAAHKPAK